MNSSNTTHRHSCGLSRARDLATQQLLAEMSAEDMTDAEHRVYRRIVHARREAQREWGERVEAIRIQGAGVPSGVTR